MGVADLPLEEMPELERLRLQVKQYEQAEQNRLKELVLDLRHERDHWKAECNRNIEIGRQINANAEQVIGLLRNEVQTLRETYARRDARPVR